MLPRILLIGDDACRASLILLIKVNFTQAEIFQTKNLCEGISRIQQGQPDLVLADIDLIGGRPLETLKAVILSHPSVRFAVLSISHSRELISASLAAGMRGILSKRQPDEDVLSAIKEILDGGVYVPGYSVAGNGGGGALCEIPNLTPRQRQVFRLLSLGMSNKEIARALRIAESTTKIHTAMLMRALGVRNRTEAAFKAGKLLNSMEAAPETKSYKHLIE